MLVEMLKSVLPHCQALVTCLSFLVSSQPPSRSTLINIIRRRLLRWFIYPSINSRLRARPHKPLLHKVRRNDVVRATSKSRPYPRQEVIEVCGDEACG